MTISLNDLEKYFAEYVTKYRQEYKRFTSAPPAGPGYPKLAVSPYLNDSQVDIYLANDGVVINQIGIEPDYQWYIAGGPALKVDYEPTVTAKEITEILKQNDLVGKPIGIYRIVSKKKLANKIWKGRIDGIIKTFSREVAVSGIKVNYYQLSSSLRELLTILTFGAFGSILEAHLPDNTNDIGSPHIVRKIGIFPADLNNRRFFEYMEIYGQADCCAWDRRLITLRVKSDLRRDFSQALSLGEREAGGTLSFGSTNDWAENYTNRLINLKKAIDAFRDVLHFKGKETEDVFHKLLETHPILLDVYGICESKPKLQYPNGQTSIIGKKYLEPDFIVRYPDQSYKLVELERASKGMATKEGQPKAELTQATFQIAEWRHFIKSHYQTIKDKYPGIQSKCKSMIIMSRSRQKEFGGLEDQKQYVELVIELFKVDEVLTYDDLFERACYAYYQLTGLSPSSI